VIERACILADDEFISERQLAIGPSPAGAAASAAGPQTDRIAAGASAAPDKELLVTVERDHIQRALVRAGGNKKAAAKMLGLSRRALYRRLERLDLSDTITRRRDAIMMAEA
jgi:DNA-binding NtrC family response regulator